MPDTFGQETPQEALARVRAGFTSQRQAFNNSSLAQISPGARAGQALANIFGGTIRKSLDTRAARSSEAARLVEETGLSAKEAREQAKSTVPRQFDEVRKAKQFEKATSGAQEIIEQLTPVIGPALAQANGMLVVARELRTMGFQSEATNMTLQAGKMREQEELRLAELDKLKTATRASGASADLSEARLDEVGETPYTQTVNKETELLAQIDASSDPKEIVQLERELVRTQQHIEKLNFLGFGRTVTDAEVLGLTKPTITSLEKSLVDSGNQLDLLSSIGDTYDPKFLTYAGQIGNWLAVMAEKGGATLPSGAQEFVEEYSAFRRNSIDGLNRYIKLITGAQMSEAEADRLRKAFPDAENDSPTQFMSKYVAATQQIMAVRARAQYALESGDIGIMPKDLQARADKDGNYGSEAYGQDLAGYMPTEEQARKLLGLPAEIGNRGVKSNTVSPEAEAAAGEISVTTQTVLDALTPRQQ